MQLITERYRADRKLETRAWVDQSRKSGDIYHGGTNPPTGFRAIGNAHLVSCCFFHPLERSTKSHEISTKETFGVDSWIVLLGMGSLLALKLGQ